MTARRVPFVLAPFIVILLTVHLAQDVVYGFEEGDLSDLRAAAISGVWLYVTLALAGRRLGCVLLLLGSLLSPVVALAHMSGEGVGDDISGRSGTAFFVWTLIAIGAAAPVAILFSIQELWRLKQSVLGFFLWTAIPVSLGGGLLGYVVDRLN